MDNILVIVKFRDGAEERIDCCSHEIKNCVLRLYKRYDRTICYPLDAIAKYEILN